MFWQRKPKHGVLIARRDNASWQQTTTEHVLTPLENMYWQLTFWEQVSTAGTETICTIYCQRVLTTDVLTTRKKKKCPRRKMSNDNTSWQHPLVTTHTVLLHNTHEGSGRKGNETLQGITDIASVRVINNCIASCTIDRQLLRQLRREKRFCLLYNAKSGNNYRYAVDRINT